MNLDAKAFADAIVSSMKQYVLKALLPIKENAEEAQEMIESLGKDLNELSAKQFDSDEFERILNDDA